jgi:hypothetical protein
MRDVSRRTEKTATSATAIRKTLAGFPMPMMLTIGALMGASKG